jgi:hypothetical protein
MLLNRKSRSLLEKTKSGLRMRALALCVLHTDKGPKASTGHLYHSTELPSATSRAYIIPDSLFRVFVISSVVILRSLCYRIELLPLDSLKPSGQRAATTTAQHATVRSSIATRRASQNSHDREIDEYAQHTPPTHHPDPPHNLRLGRRLDRHHV